jgi:flagellar biosynthesis/type III secretory pathway M-ring protein FliF/YscJ
VRGLAPAESNVVAEESLRAPGESILSAQDEALDRIRDGVRQSVTRNPREAADVARRWMSP